MKKENRKVNKTTFLLPRNNFLIGLGSILNVFGSYFSYNSSKTTEIADSKAIYCDWRMVGNDFRNALKS